MFEKIGIKRIQANIVPDNTSSLGLLNKAGFVMEGLLYSYRVFKGKQIDVVMAALSSDKYFNDIRLQSQVKQLWNYIPSHSNVVKKMKKCETLPRSRPSAGKSSVICWTVCMKNTPVNNNNNTN